MYYVFAVVDEEVSEVTKVFRITEKEGSKDGKTKRRKKKTNEKMIVRSVSKIYEKPILIINRCREIRVDVIELRKKLSRKRKKNQVSITERFYYSLQLKNVEIKKEV